MTAMESVQPYQTSDQAEPKISIVMPTRNEAKNLPHVFAEIPADVHEIIVIDGYSTDGTVEVAQFLDPRVKIVYQSRKGKGNALAHGFAAVTGDIIVMLDADCSADPKEIPIFVEALRNGADLAKGSRYMKGGGSTDITIVRSSGNRALTSQVNVLFGTRYTDLCYGYCAFWTHCVPLLALDADGFEVETMINIRAAKAKLTVAEVPSFEYPRLHGASNLNAFRDGLRVQRTIWRERFNRRGSPIVPQVERRGHTRGERIEGSFERRACFRYEEA